jgi:hypothetical protein
MKTFECKLFFLFTLFLLPDAVYCQFFHNYESELKIYLNPPIDTTTTKEIAFFMGASTYPIPEHSIRIIKSRNKFSIEARIFGKNLSKVITENELSILQGKNKDSYTIETFTSIKPISDSMKEKMLIVFNKVITYNDDSVKSMVKLNADGTTSLMIYDGPIYKFRVNNKDHLQMDIQYPLDSTDFRSLVVKTNFQIINDLKNNSFYESKYTIYK